MRYCYVPVCDTQSVVIIPVTKPVEPTLIPILPASPWNVDQIFVLGLDISSIIGNFIIYDPAGRITLSI